MVSGPSAPRYDYTDQNGQVIFPLVDEGVYEVTIEAPSGYISIPSSQSTTVEVGDVDYLDFYVARAGSLTIRLVENGVLIQNQSSVEIAHSIAGQITTSGPDGEFTFVDIYPGVWSVNSAWASGYETTSGQTVDVPSGGNAVLEIEMEPLPMADVYITVYESGTSNTISDATVTLTNQSTQEVVTGLTNSQGVFSQTVAAGTYDLTVTKDGYLTYTNTLSLPADQTTYLDVYLSPQPQTGAIRVRTERWWNGNPRNNVPIRVIGPNGYDRIQYTGDYAPGETLFTDLEPGTYYVYRYWWGWWIGQRIVQVTAGNTSYVLYSY